MGKLIYFLEDYKRKKAMDTMLGANAQDESIDNNYDKISCERIINEIQFNRRAGYTYTSEEMKSLAERFLKSIGYDYDGAVPVIKIAKEMGIKVVCGPMVDYKMSGFISVDKKTQNKYGSDKVIGINEDDELGHQRFVIAHELAHYLFDYDFQSNEPYYDTYIKNSHKSLKERIANTFATNLLLPAKAFILKFDERKSMDRNIKEWTEYFDVQEKAVEKRVIEVLVDGV